MDPGIFTRGILVDIPLMKGVPYQEPGTAIFASDLEAWEQYAGVKIGSLPVTHPFRQPDLFQATRYSSARVVGLGVPSSAPGMRLARRPACMARSCHGSSRETSRCWAAMV
jgi:hypothetical protein